MMNISLTSELENFVANKVETGMYQTASEVVREGLRLLKEREQLQREKWEELHREIALGLQQADEGKVGPLNAKETLARVRGKRKLSTKKGNR